MNSDETRTLSEERGRDRGPDARRPLELAVIVPTFNEGENITELYARLERTLADVRWEMIVVDDDSPDDTSVRARELGRPGHEVRVIRRIGRRGLSTAVIEGMLSTGAEKLAVIDADLQHDETVLPQMLEILRKSDTEIVIGSRYVEGGGIGEWNRTRASMSSFATRLARLVLHADVSDPMSGFFMIRRDSFERVVRDLSGEGYKILLDIFASAQPPLRYKEVPYTFRPRLHGESKLDGAVLWEYLILIADKWVGNYIPARLLLFAIVGGTGVVIHFSILSLLFLSLGEGFATSQLFATVGAMTTNYIFNNLVTYRDQRKRGFGFVKGLVGFYLICSVGLIGNVGIANAIFGMKYQWWAAAGAGILIGTIWNYAASSMFVWKKKG